MSYIMGMDFSITSPSICLYDIETEKYNIISWVSNKFKKFKRDYTVVGDFSFEVKFIDRDESENTFYFDLVDSIILTLKDFDIIGCYSGMEQYAFSGSGMLTKIAECVGALKYKFYEHYNKNLLEIAIPSGKMCVNAEHKGNVGKYTNIEYFIKTFCPNLLEKLNIDIQDLTPLSDWVDSYGIAKYIYYMYLYDSNKKDIIPSKIIKSIENRGK